MAYYAIEPFGQYPKYYRTGIVASIIANVHRGKRSQAFRPEDFMPKEPKISMPRSQTIEEQKSVLQSIFDLTKRRTQGNKKRKKKR